MLVCLYAKFYILFGEIWQFMGELMVDLDKFGEFGSGFDGLFGCFGVVFGVGVCFGFFWFRGWAILVAVWSGLWVFDRCLDECRTDLKVNYYDSV